MQAISVSHLGRAGAFITTSVAVFILAGVPSYAYASGPASSRLTAEFEATFMMQMSDHHLMAVRSGELCTTKATHEELRSMCRDIVSSQTEEIQKFQRWLAQWYSVSYTPKLNPRNEQSLSKLAGLSGGDFEREFMQMMNVHHMMAIQRAVQCNGRVQHGELDQACETIITSQAKEIDDMHTWLCQWYQVCETRTSAVRR